MVGDDWSVPQTNNGEGMNMAKWVGIWEEWMNRMLSNGFQVKDLPAIAAQHGEQFPKSLLATATSKNTLFPSANMLFEYDLDNKMKRSYPHNNADYPGGTGYGEWQPMDQSEVQSANDYYAWRENPKNYDFIDNKFGGNAYNAYLSAGNGYKVQSALGSGAKVSNGAAAKPSVTGSGTDGLGNLTGDTGLISEMAKNMRLDTQTQQFNLQKSMQEYGEGRPIQNYLTDFYGDIMGVKFDRPQWDWSGYFDQLNGVGNQSGSTTTDRLVRPAEWDQMTDQEKQQWRQDQTSTPTTDPLNDNRGGNRGDGTGRPRTDPSGGGPVYNPPRLPPANDPSLNPGRYSPNGDVEKTSAGFPMGLRSDIAGGGSSYGGGQANVPWDPNGDYSMPWSENPMNPYSPNYTGSTSGGGGGGGDVNSQADVNGSPAQPPIQSTDNFNPALPGSQFLSTNLPNADYHLSSPGDWNPNNPNSWSMLGQPASEIAGDMDAQKKALMRGLPAGGERNLAVAQATNQGYGNLGALRQNLVGKSLDSLQGISTQKMTGQPVQPGNTAGQLLSAYTQQQGQNQNYSLGQQQLTQQKDNNKSQLWGNIIGGLAGVAGAAILASDPKVKKDVKKHKGSLEEVKKLDPVDYTYTDKVSEYGPGVAGQPGQKGVSVMADKAKKAMPEAVGKDKASGFSTIDPMEILMNVVNSIKDLDMKVSALGKGRK